MSTRVSLAAAGIATVLLLGSVSCKERAKMAADTPSTKSLLDKILNAPTEEQYREALRQYGPVLAQDIDYLAQQSQSEQPTIRRHAARLLVTTLKGGALRVLRARWLTQRTLRCS